MPILRTAMPMLASAALISFLPGLAAAQGCEERLAQTEEKLKAVELSPGRRAEVRQVAEQARAMARSGEQEECLRATRHLEYTLASLEELRSGQHQPSGGAEEAPAPAETEPTLAAIAKERLRENQAAREGALARSREQEDEAGSGATGRRPPEGEEELTAAMARVREDLAPELGGAQAPAGTGAGGPLSSQEVTAGTAVGAQPLPQEPSPPPATANARTAAERGPGPCEERIEVGSGDTLFGIARRCRTTVDALLKANPEIKDPARIRVGQAVRIPTGAGEGGEEQTAAEARAVVPRQPGPDGPDTARLEQAGAERDAQVALMRAQAAVRTAEGEAQPQQEAVAMAKEPDSDAAPAEGRSVGPCEESIEVGSGDTLYGIARRCGTTVDALLKANPEIRDPARIRVGQKIALPAS